jgi:ankyrin repeat protein
VRELVSHGAEVNHKGSDGRSALMWACASGKIETVMYLLEQGADYTLTNSEGLTALDWAEDAEHKEIAELIRGYNK